MDACTTVSHVHLLKYCVLVSLKLLIHHVLNQS